MGTHYFGAASKRLSRWMSIVQFNFSCRCVSLQLASTAIGGFSDQGLFLSAHLWFPIHHVGCIVNSVLKPLSAIRDNNYADICCDLDNLEHGICTPEVVPRAELRTRGQDLRNLIPMSEIHNLFRNIISLKYSGFDVKV